MLNKTRGQSTVEYIILVTAVVSVAILFLMAPGSDGKGSLFTQKINSTLQTVVSNMDDIAKTQQKSHQADTSTGADWKGPSNTFARATSCLPGFSWKDKSGTCEDDANKLIPIDNIKTGN